MRNQTLIAGTVLAADPARPRAHVLVVENNAAIALDLRHLLHLLGSETTIATSGEQAMTLARQQRFDLIILNLNLPDIIGLEVCRRLKIDPLLKAIPVVFLSGEANPGFADIAFRLGAVECLALPYEAEDFKKRVLAHLPKPPKVCIQMDLACGATN